LNGEFHSFLQDGLMNVVSALFACHSIGEMSARRKYPLPAPLLPCVWIFSLERVRQCDAAQTAIKIALVLSLYQIKVLEERFFHCGGKHRVPIFVTFAGTYNYLVGGEIDIFDPKL
jgi:hypothetical protein